MNDEPSGNDSGLQPSPSSGMAELKAQCERLQQVVHELQEEKRQDGEALADMRKQLSEYEHFLYGWARQQVREEDWQDFVEHDYAIGAEQALKELERQEGT